MALVRNQEARTGQGKEDTGEEAYGEKIVKKKNQYNLTTNGLERGIRDTSSLGLFMGNTVRFFRGQEVRRGTIKQ